MPNAARHESALTSESLQQSMHVIAAMSTPFLLAGHDHFMNASIGNALYPDDGVTADELLRNADTAMYRAKDSGRGQCVFFEERMNADAIARLRSE
jgi:diguanylate cyclase (GGDEF)-like protein